MGGGLIKLRGAKHSDKINNLWNGVLFQTGAFDL